MTKGQDVTAKAATDFRQPACLPARRGLRRTWLRNLVAGGSALLVASCQLLGDGPTVGTVTPGTLRPNLAADIGEREHPRVVATYGGVYKDAGAERAVASVVGRLVAASEDPRRATRSPF